MNRHRIHVRGARLVDPASNTDRVCDLFIADGIILSWDRPPADFTADQTIDAQGLVACPGLVDLDVHLREPGFDYQASIESELAAALSGGVTSMACPPDTHPVLDEPGLVEMVKYRSQQLQLGKVYPIGALTKNLAGERLTEMAELAEVGCIAFGQAQRGIVDTQVLQRALLYAANFNLPVWLSPADPFLSSQGCAHQGVTALRLGLAGIPFIAEVLDAQRLIMLAAEAGARLHLCHVTARQTLEIIGTAHAAGLPISSDVSLAHLFYCDEDLADFNTNLRTDPVLRSRDDQRALRRAVASGRIDALCSQHRPVNDDAKRLPFAEAESGISALEFLLPLTLQWGREENLSLLDTLRPVTVRPAQLMGIAAGTLAPNAAADVCVFDPQETYTLSAANLESLGKNSPFLGRPLQGRVVYTLVDGSVVFSKPPTS